jgi:hypothetical protein
MKDSQRITRYLVEFNRLAAQTQWGESALRHQFYRGLPPRIKDEVSRVGKPATLVGFRQLAQSIDARYWERRSEINREAPASKSEPSKRLENTKPSDKPSTKPQEKRPSTNPPPRPSNPGSTSSNSKTTDLSGKLGQDGKLTQEERNRRFANNLCLFCGGMGHMAKDCSKRTKSDAKAKGRSAKSSKSSKSTVSEVADAPEPSPASNDSSKKA